MKPHTWYLKYQTEDGPAKMEVVFTADAVCLVDGTPANCNALLPPSGSKINASGAPDGDFFRVNRLEVTTK